MRLRVSVDVWCTAFATTLGLLPGCGGNAFAPSGTAAGGASSGGAVNSLGGSGHSGGTQAGGAVSIGGSGGAAHLGGSGGMAQGGSGGATTLGGSGGAAQGGSGGSGGSPMESCPNPQPVLVQGKDSGFVSCGNGITHRAQVNTCPSTLPRAVACDVVIEGVTNQCTSDSQCTASPNGFCSPNGGGQVPGCFCQYGCVADSDCAQGQICECGEPVGRCVPSNCKDDAACGQGNLCASYRTCFGIGGYACQTPQDACLADTTCTDGFCGLSVANTRECQPTITCAAIGRPFLVVGTERIATLGNRSGWQSSNLTPDCTLLDPQARTALAEAWAKNGLMEHASIAAFARFALQLMALGAPASLLEETHAAMADETRHAQHCFALASSFAGTRLGPERLAVDRALEDITPKQVLITTILEGCIGETVAAVEAAEALQFATDEAVRSVLQQITVDEEKHAALAWNTVRFLLAEHPELVPVARQVFSEACSPERSRDTGLQEVESEMDLTFLCYGVVGMARRAEIRAQVLAGVVAPCARALLGDSGLVSEPHLLALC